VRRERLNTSAGVKLDMPVAFVLVNTELGAEKELVEELRKVDGVVEVHAVYGVYDVIVKVQAGSVDELKEIVNRRIRMLDGVCSTLTMIVAEG